MGRCRQLAALTLCLALLLPLAGPAAAGPPALAGKVLWVYDGDTLQVEGIGKVRLLGIDAPERKASERDRFYLRQKIAAKTLRRVGDEALAYLIATAKGQRVSLSLDRQHRDRYGRLLAYVHLPDGRLLNLLLIEKGLAAVYRRFDFALKEDFLAAERQAKKAGVGLWER